MKVGIIGATGYGGAEMMRIMKRHPYVDECILYSSKHQGTTYCKQYPHTVKLTEQTLEPIEAAQIVADIDFLFMAAPSGVCSKLIAEFEPYDIPVIDLSGDLRMKDAAVYESWYHHAAPPQSALEKAVYGLSELNHDEIKVAKYIANPGCFPTATLLGLAPLIKNGLINESFLIIDAKTGVSGAGRKASIGTHFSEVNENLKIYKVNEHQHLPEIEQTIRYWIPVFQPITFSTHLVPMTRGIMATIYTELKTSMKTNELQTVFSDFYQNSYFIRVREVGQFPETKEVYGSNFCDIGISADERTNRVTVVSVIDNLMKGAAGQAVQNFNIMNGWSETTGLEFAPIYP
ncbi:N-acetyl-gamma-glutamyl-phosphate reductase [Bacillus changyiensis]|uniref:N-acetyl-gamma-glutamyl-phosphate reductase n=1 Tax=Bacillus changyiensis TaxID=3004103 RepID=UPI0022DEFE0A|nr:N-acetyl-gamma-glutamyl-phosphate reductase [Bacillus changyiensis]MDA1475944.1 N-acetyl-gamma-glutamyl-phosphate reductase [Bacillus changyiensis]